MTDKQPDAPAPPKPDRIAKWMARAGLCSRRDAERWIADGRVAVDGKVIESPALTVAEPERIAVDGKPLPAIEHTRLWRYHKPAGLVTTARDPQGRPTVFERLPPELPRVVAVGRLDLTTEGLLLLTNDGELARRLELPANGWRRVYRVRVFGKPAEGWVDRLGEGVTVDGVRYGPVEVAEESRSGANAWLSVTLREGKNREVRKVLDHVGLAVNRLIRVQYGPFKLGDLARGQVVEVPGPAMRKAAGLLPKARAGWAKAKPKPKTKPARKRRVQAGKPGADRRRPA